MDKKSEQKNDKFITGKMIDYIGNEFDVFLGKNMSIFRHNDLLFIQPPYKYVINDNFLENNRSQSKHGPLNSFFIDEKSQILSFYPINCKIEITSNDNKKTFSFIKEKNTTSSKETEIMITHPTFKQTKINKEDLVIDDTTTIADIFKQLKIQNLMPNKIKPPNNKTDNIKNDIKKTNEPTNNTSNSLFDEKCCCGFSLNDIKNNLCCCLT